MMLLFMDGEFHTLRQLISMVTIISFLIMTVTLSEALLLLLVLLIGKITSIIDILIWMVVQCLLNELMIQII